MFYYWALFLVLLCVYCMLEKREKFISATVCKVLLSAFVAGVAIYAAVRLQSFLGTLMALGLAFAVPADYFLQFIRRDVQKYRVGILSFGTMHACLLAAFFVTWGVGYLEFVLFAAFLLILSLFQRSEKWSLGKVKGLLSIYTVLVVLMASKAISVFIATPSIPTFALGLGGFCFFVSDLFLGIWNYYRTQFLFLALSRIVYFVGQLLLATSLMLMV